MIDTRFYRRLKEIDAVCVLHRNGKDMAEASVFNIGAGGVLIEKTDGSLTEGDTVVCTIIFRDGVKFVMDATVQRVQERSVALHFQAPPALVDRISKRLDKKN